MSPFHLLLRFVLTVLLVWAMSTFLPGSLLVTGGWLGYVIIGSLLTLLNILVRPFLAIITFPLRLLATLVAIILVNAAFLWLLELFAAHMDPAIVTLTINQSWQSWLLVSTLLGGANWLFKHA